MTDEQKADTLVALNEQSNLMIDRLYGRETPSTPIILEKQDDTGRKYVPYNQFHLGEGKDGNAPRGAVKPEREDEPIKESDIELLKIVMPKVVPKLQALADMAESAKAQVDSTSPAQIEKLTQTAIEDMADLLKHSKEKNESEEGEDGEKPDELKEAEKVEDVLKNVQAMLKSKQNEVETREKKEGEERGEQKSDKDVKEVKDVLSTLRELKTASDDKTWTASQTKDSPKNSTALSSESSKGTDKPAQQAH